MASDEDAQRLRMLAAVSWYRGEVGPIEELWARNEELRDMCEDLAEVEAALARLDAMNVPSKAERRRECLEWIERLRGEITRALRGVNVISMTRKP